MTTVRVFAPAKINLTLHVTGLRSDGYHELDTLVVFARDVGDRVAATPVPNLNLTVTGPMSAGVPNDESNLALRAARLMQELRGVRDGAHLTIDKHLPNGGGIGGGSSDAAATIAALSRLWHVPPLSLEEAAPIGADVPVCLSAPCPMRMRGIGDRLDPILALPPIWLVLANPGAHISTRRVFELLDLSDGFGRAPMEPMPASWDFETLGAWLAPQINDLTKCAREIVPEIGDVLDALHAQGGCVDADMSGSGSTCWALFSNARDAQNAAKILADARAEWWVRATSVAS